MFSFITLNFRIGTFIKQNLDFFFFFPVKSQQPNTKAPSKKIIMNIKYIK